MVARCCERVRVGASMHLLCSLHYLEPYSDYQYPYWDYSYLHSYRQCEYE
jgi:hypothetical protein